MTDTEISRELREIVSALREKDHSKRGKDWVARLLELNILLLTAELFLLTTFSAGFSKIMIGISSTIICINILMGSMYYLATNELVLTGESRRDLFSGAWWYFNADKVMIRIFLLSAIAMTISIFSEIFFSLVK